MFVKINSTTYNDIILNETFVNNNILEKRITLKFSDYQTMKNEFLKITSIEENIQIQVFDSKENLIDEFQGLKKILLFQIIQQMIYMKFICLCLYH